jgi:uncharacterized protein YecT (DUF1311 family)
MFLRRVHACGFALLTAAACSTGEHDQASERGARRASVDSASRTSTREMSHGLTDDLQQAERDLAALQDSIYLFLGDTTSAMLKQARVSWEHYRKLECDAIRVEFAPGTMAPIAQLECWVALTDARRRFLGEQHDFIRPARAGAR